MSKFVIVYFGGNRPESPEAGQAHMADFMGWIKGLGDAAISPMNPMGQSSFITKSSISDEIDRDKMNGYTVIEAKDKAAAIKIAQACPFLDIGGTIELAELIQMG